MANTQSSEWFSLMETMLGSVKNEHVKLHRIFKVPEQLRELRKEAYKPKVVSIGPIHRGTDRDLLYMEEIKYHCMRSLFRRTCGGQVKMFHKCCKAILKLDETVRAFYVDGINFNSYELAKIMILDGCFLLELLISNAKEEIQSLSNLALAIQNPSPESDAASEVRKMGYVLSDLKLIENQIPLTVLISLFHLLFANESDIMKTCEPIRNTINRLALIFFGCSSSPTAGHNQNRAHILELVHSFITEKEGEIGGESRYRSITIKTSENRNYETISQLNCCAIRLQAAGVTIMPVGEQNAIVFGCYSSFSDQTLKIQPLSITEETEILWWNLIAWEQNRITHEKYLNGNRTSCKVSEFALLFKGLICCEDDIEVLKKLKVLVVTDEKKWSNQKLMDFFRTIAHGIQINASEDSEYGQKIKPYSCCGGNVRIFKHNCRRILTNVKYKFRDGFETLKRDHTPTVWKTIGVIAAVVLLLLTVSQTVLAAIAL